MNVNISRCWDCGKTIHYADARLLPPGGGVCQNCASAQGYERCEECGDYFVPEGDEHFCESCFARMFAELQEGYESSL